VTTEELFKQGTGIAAAITAIQALVWVVRRYVLKEDRAEDRLTRRLTEVEAQLAQRDAAIADLHKEYGRKLEQKERESRADARMVHRAAIALGDVPESIEGLANSMARSNAMLTSEVAAVRAAVRAQGIRVDNVLIEPVPETKSLRAPTPPRPRMTVARPLDDRPVEPDPDAGRTT